MPHWYAALLINDDYAFFGWFIDVVKHVDLDFLETLFVFNELPVQAETCLLVEAVGVIVASFEVYKEL